jgi:hypothetical protein
MANAQTTRGQKLGEKPPEVATIYSPDGKPHQCAPVDAREILARGLGYTAEPPASLTGEAIFDQAYAEVEKKKAAREQQSEQQPESGDAVASGETVGKSDVKPDDPGPADAAGKTGAGSSGKSRSRK